MPHTPKRRERTKQLIITTAKVLFYRHGFEAASINEIMAHAGLTHGASITTSRPKRICMQRSWLTATISTLPTVPNR